MNRKKHELIDALKWCSKEKMICLGKRCPYFEFKDCTVAVLQDALETICELEKEVFYLYDIINATEETK